MLPCSSQATMTTRMPAMAALAGLVPCADCGMRATSRCASPRDVVIRANHEQARELALRAGVGLQRDGREPGDAPERVLELAEDLVVSGGLLRGHERVHPRELRPADGHHLGGRIQLHRARPERNHRRVEAEVLALEVPDVAHHLGLGVMRDEDRMRHERRGALHRRGQGRRRSRRPTASPPTVRSPPQTRPRCRRRSSSMTVSFSAIWITPAAGYRKLSPRARRRGGLRAAAPVVALRAASCRSRRG